MKKLLLGAALAGVLGAGALYAQTVTVTSVTSVGPNDLIPVIPNGVPAANAVYATAAKINGPSGYVRTVPLTAFTLSFANGQTNYLIVPAGTLATGTFNFSPNPTQGQLNCVRSTATQTAVTLAASAGQTITGGITAMTAATTYCYIYDAATSIWNLWSTSAG